MENWAKLNETIKQALPFKSNNPDMHIVRIGTIYPKDCG
jgi:hypothetical protein